jgi:hypothetical protein
MKVILKPVSGTPKANLERAKYEMERVLSFRGTVGGVKALNNSIEVKVSINPAWDLPKQQRVDSLKEWIPAKARKVFEVIRVSEEELNRQYDS